MLAYLTAVVGPGTLCTNLAPLVGAADEVGTVGVTVGGVTAEAGIVLDWVLVHGHTLEFNPEPHWQSLDRVDFNLLL